MVGYQSQLGANEPVLGDGFGDEYWFTTASQPDGTPYHRGYQARNWHDHPFGSTPAKPFDMLTIPRSEWDDRIAEMEGQRTRLSDLLDEYAVPVKNQRQTNYCWIFAPVHCCEIIRVRQGNSYVSLSPASCGGPIKNYQNVGGWGSEGLNYILEHGIVPTSMWPDTAIARQYDTSETRLARERYQALEWSECRPKDLDQLMTLLFHRIPVAVGYNWWGHEVTAIDPVKVNGQYGGRINNSWGTSWGDNGRGVLVGSKAVPDDAVAPRTITPS